MNVLACSYHCWFPGRLNGRCSGAARMNGWPLSSHDNLLPTALILHRDHWSASYWFFLFLSLLVLLFLPLHIRPSRSLLDLSALAKKIKLEAMASYNSNHQHGGPNGENGDHNPGLGESCPRSHCMHVTCRITRRVAVVCTRPWCHVSTTCAAVVMCGCWTELIETRMWHHVYVSNKPQQQWFSSSEKSTSGSGNPNHQKHQGTLSSTISLFYFSPHFYLTLINAFKDELLPMLQICLQLNGIQEIYPEKQLIVSFVASVAGFSRYSHRERVGPDQLLNSYSSSHTLNQLGYSLHVQV